MQGETWSVDFPKSFFHQESVKRFFKPERKAMAPFPVLQHLQLFAASGYLTCCMSCSVPSCHSALLCWFLLPFLSQFKAQSRRRPSLLVPQRELHPVPPELLWASLPDPLAPLLYPRLESSLCVSLSVPEGRAFQGLGYSTTVYVESGAWI